MAAALDALKLRLAAFEGGDFPLAAALAGAAEAGGGAAEKPKSAKALAADAPPRASSSQDVRKSSIVQLGGEWHDARRRPSSAPLPKLGLAAAKKRKTMAKKSAQSVLLNDKLKFRTAAEVVAPRGNRALVATSVGEGPRGASRRRRGCRADRPGGGREQAKMSPRCF